MRYKKGLVTGAAGFIGFHLVDKLVKLNLNVFGLDIINSYYDINLKYDRLKEHGIEKKNLKKNNIVKSSKYENYHFIKADLADHNFIVDFMIKNDFDFVVNLAAQPGVRYSIDNPQAYTHSNINGFLSILEGCRNSNVKNLIYASTSSLYGLNSKMPLNEDDFTSHPMALYAATKKANELMAHSYSHLYKIPTTGLRFFTVYGPWGRPDMSYFLFANAIINKKPIKIFNHGNMIRDFTFIDDIIESIFRLIKRPAKENKSWDSNNPLVSSSSAPYQIFNIGNSEPVKLMDFISCIETELKIVAKKKFLEIQPGDVLMTHSDTSSLYDYIGYKPKINFEAGIRKFTKWFLNYYNIKNEF